ncbi:cytochrome P450 72A397-like [Impatiens glandulifera]|uniref:cytochrome P450 72A397-like n=1 Tax=Impatiens glandulifera TaxID=253017 RepID=UPI001FB104E4|nr:cytochrome P450 72A397-like [Impatiens glandulifera]
MSIDDVIQECKLFYFAGQESTANLLIWTMVLLSIHQEWQTRAREEVNQLFGNSKPNIEGIGHLKVISMILYEVLRLYPPSLMFYRSIDEETRLGEMTLPAGLQFLLPIILVHHDEEIWGKDAKMFKPERFSNGVAKATKNQIMYFPFSWGPRICVGNNFTLLEAKLALVMILQRFSFKLSPSYSHAPTYVVTLQPQNGVHLILEKL